MIVFKYICFYASNFWLIIFTFQNIMSKITNETFENMWNMLKENEFQIDSPIKSEIICTSCEHILIKPVNVPCGCRYCYNCIQTYLNGKEKFCLGLTGYCENELLNLNENVFFDQVANIKISGIVVKCPHEFCEFTTRLGNMANHVRACDKQPMICPYFSIGCKENKVDADKMKQHFKEENYCHSRLLADSLNNYGNEIKL